jgi:hypothetical protein
LALPPALRGAWDEILHSEARLGEALESGELAALEPLASRRHAQILAFFERLGPEPDSAPLRLELLRTLTARNEALLRDSRARLAAVGDGARQARHNRRALQAYAGQRDQR